MATRISHIYELAKLQSFDVAAFKGSDDVPQYVCDFVLTLALAFNDLRDLYHVQKLILSENPKEITS